MVWELIFGFPTYFGLRPHHGPARWPASTELQEVAGFNFLVHNLRGDPLQQ